MALEDTLAPKRFSRLFDRCHALSLDDQLRDVVRSCERHDIMTFARMVCLKHAGHQDILNLTSNEAKFFIEDIDLFLTAVISMQAEKQ